MKTGEQIQKIVDQLIYNQLCTPDYPSEDGTNLDKEEARIQTWLDNAIVLTKREDVGDWLRLGRLSVETAFARLRMGDRKAGLKEIESAIEYLRNALNRKPHRVDFIGKPGGGIIVLPHTNRPMTKIGTIFRFAAPIGWAENQDKNSFVFHGPNREELIVSASFIQGIGTMTDLAAVQRRLFQNAEQSMKNAAEHPSLKVLQPFQQDSSLSKVECWTLLARTQEADTIFYQAVFRDPRGVLLATLEAPNTASSTSAFEQFVKAVEVISEREA